jgi:hypothetical protein
MQWFAGQQISSVSSPSPLVEQSSRQQAGMASIGKAPMPCLPVFIRRFVTLDESGDLRVPALIRDATPFPCRRNVINGNAGQSRIIQCHDNTGISLQRRTPCQAAY